jgi:hypothetical protein
MKITPGSIIALALSLFLVRTVQARNDKYVLPIQAALETKNVLGKPDGSVTFFYGKQRDHIEARESGNPRESSQAS